MNAQVSRVEGAQLRGGRDDYSGAAQVQSVASQLPNGERVDDENLSNLCHLPDANKVMFFKPENKALITVSW